MPVVQTTVKRLACESDVPPFGAVLFPDPHPMNAEQKSNKANSRNDLRLTNAKPTIVRTLYF
ncbi:MAG: hypothetical protein U0894_10635 [Pirellulales bacterium]